MTLPGDWHLGLNMTQAIFNYCCVGFLDEFQSLLGWKQINKETSSCYYQVMRLIAFVQDELIIFFAHQFVSQHADQQGNGQSNTQYVVTLVRQFKNWLRELKSS
jgi:hypothetical protein